MTPHTGPPPPLQNERVLFHYNGHGVPRPTSNGEIWVFNKSYTQYIPLSIYDLQVRLAWGECGVAACGPDCFLRDKSGTPASRWAARMQLAARLSDPVEWWWWQSGGV